VVGGVSIVTGYYLKLAISGRIDIIYGIHDMNLHPVIIAIIVPTLANPEWIINMTDRPNPQTEYEYNHNLDMLESLLNSRIKSNNVIRLINVRTRIARNAIKAEENFISLVTSQTVLKLCNDRLERRVKRLTQVLKG
jgi:hypothetical protein